MPLCALKLHIPSGMAVRVHASECLPGSDSRLRAAAGAQESTAEVEDELLALWSSVEKDKAAAREHVAAAAGLARRKRRRVGGRPGGDGAAGRWSLWNMRGGGRWQQLQACVMSIKQFFPFLSGVDWAGGSFQHGTRQRNACRDEFWRLLT